LNDFWFYQGGVILLDKKKAYEPQISYATFEHFPKEYLDPNMQLSPKSNNGWFSKSLNYNVLDTDYENYSIVYSCTEPYLYGKVDERVWAFTRKPIAYEDYRAVKDFKYFVDQKLMNKFGKHAYDLTGKNL